MPVNKSNIGIGRETPIKQEHFRGIVKIIANAAKSILNQPWSAKRYDPWFRMYDIYCGSGQYKNDDGELIVGSPLVALDVVRSIGIPYQAVFIDKVQDNTDKLAKLVGKDSFVKIECGENDYVLPNYFVTRKPCYGYVYVDPNNIDIPLHLLTRMFSYSTFERVDLIINISATALKRAANSSMTKYYGQTFDKMLDELKRYKPYMVIREPHGRDQWTFIVASNWKNLPEWTKQGFVNLTTAKGIEIFEKLVYTNQQRRDMESERVQSSFNFDVPLNLYPQRRVR